MATVSGRGFSDRGTPDCVPLTDPELDVLLVAADELIPGHGPWPVPSATGGLGSYLRDGASRPADVASLKRTAARLCAPDVTFTRATPEDRIARLEALETSAPHDFFDLQEFVYCGYYAQPEVVAVIQTELGCDYHSPPQPVGYEMELDENIPAPSIGSYTPTGAVVRLDLTVLPPGDDRPWPTDAGDDSETVGGRS